MRKNYSSQQQRYGPQTASLLPGTDIPAVVELDLEVSDGKGAQDLARHAQHLGVRHHEPCVTPRKKTLNSLVERKNVPT